ncbi:MAG: Planctomycete cytochrome [Chthoniobacteraceae bacterium]|nr:Planctomycete cytochrome [Chthoniobacteraceae bacterium]
MTSPASLFSITGIVLLLTANARADEFFEKRIRPVLADRCYECHSATAKKIKGSLRVDTREGLLKGGETGPAIVPGNPEESLLITAIRYHDKELRMPPPKEELPQQLPEAEINDLVAWIKAGAMMPADSSPAAGSLRRPDAKLHWAFQPLTHPTIPATPNPDWPGNALDSFILEKLIAAGLKPSAAADKRTLIRRATFDLIGLPPAPEEVRAFIEDQSPGAFAKVVDRLLASPQYGERWARHWLDLARYSDTKGYVYGREERFFVHASSYRDWVIRAFNSDLPYDQFLLLQIAADQLAPMGSPDLAAMGFLTGGRRFLGVTHDIIDDRIDVVTRGTMALTVTCARCHDHKFDPISTRDYYSLYGVFHNAAQQLVPIGAARDAAYEKEYEVRAKKLAASMKSRREESGERLRKRLGEYLAAQFELEKYPEEGFDQLLGAADLIPASVRRWRDFLRRSDTHPIFGVWNALKKIPAADFESQAGSVLQTLSLNPLVAAAFSTPPKSMAEVAERYAGLFAGIEQQAAQADKPADPAAEALRQFLYDPLSPATVPDTEIVDNELFFPTSVCTELWALQGELDRWIIQSPAAQPHALILADREPEPNPRVFRRGSPSKPGEEVPRRFLEIAAGPNRQPFTHGSGRLEMARAIVDPANPLTARVMANRVWLYHFGTGLVRTPSDFGVRAESPSHPELLDWLAGYLIEHGWSIKSLHRLIMASAVYQQSSLEPSELSAASATADPENRLLSHFPRHRLEFEQMRDAFLAVTDELDRTVGGKPGDILSPANKRRSIYGLVDRQFLPGTFRVFDFANPDLHVAQRSETTVPQQALFFLNSGFIADRARAIAKLPGTDLERISHLYSALLQRAPTEHETAAALSFIATAEDATVPKPPESAWSYGWGEYDTIQKRIKAFSPLPYFTSDAWQGGPAWPDTQLGWAQLTAEGGHAGNDLQHAVIRRWTAPGDMTIAITGKALHEFEPGDGIRVMIVSSRQGELKSAVLHHSSAEMSVPAFEVKKGETIDFVTDYLANLNTDMFTWRPVIVASAPSISWDAKKQFTGPAMLQPLTVWEQYAQVLFLSNEFLFVD